ncbi:non-canonical purine NTP diphosphatase [Saccharicrinis fermentans]|uniref:dITP/XTP pyrophosphatase n=1 Tax=Saccharicrinis fermentans DSM 9555 = JCM 21142 TaxID=869213 RepID=W7Y4A4_9BACT|nr:non-canonical purine NTP diphosphatase [Saccharicrinis fermentans]GAF02408.1 non-canonical purine NTP pyrophosphatase [Saccharicrinis fermentans DSM 9555 = JCM 21142]
MKLVFATNNHHKLQELQEILGTAIALKSLDDIHCNTEIPETGMTLEANASQKSRYIYDNYHLNCFADDTGLEIEALNGEPGVFSARYAGEEKDALKNMHKVLHKMQGIENRKARFRTVISLIIDQTEYQFEGIVNGLIKTEASGTKGFGYDPIFIPEGYPISFAEMDSMEKNKISHRARAVEKLVHFLKTR